MLILSTNKNSELTNIILIITILMSLLSSMNYSSYQYGESSNNSLVPAKWQDWTSGRGAENIHADSVEKVIVLLAQTNDISPHHSHSSSYFEELLFGDDFGSMAHYYFENSRGNTKVEGEVIGWLSLSKNLPDYDEDVWGGEEYGVGEGIEETLALADNSVDYSIYDQDNDGIIDNLMVIFVGESDAANGDGDGDGENADSNAIWPIQWGLQTAYETDDGVSASNFFVCTEYCKMGTFAHEFGHNLGLPDLYDSDYSSEGVGFWSVMGGGNYLEWNDQPNPAHFGAWSKYKLGWLTPTLVEPDSLSQEVILEPVETTGNIIKVPISELEYWLIEYRSIISGEYDRGLPSSGVLIWHIDESVTNSYGNFDNSDEEHPAIKLIQSDGNNDLMYGYNNGDIGDLFLTNSVFNNRSSPSALSWSGSDLGLSLSISNIDEDTDIATISFSGNNNQNAWFYDISWEWQDTEGDGFLNQVAFNYDIDADSEDVDVRVEFEFYSGFTNQYLLSFNSTHNVNSGDWDDFEYASGLYSPDHGLYEINVLLWVGDDLTDIYRPRHPIWLEYPSQNNQYDEWFSSFSFDFYDADGDGDNESIRSVYEIKSDDPESPNVDVRLVCFNRNDIDSKAIVIQENLPSNNFSEGVIEIDLSSYDIKPGMIGIFASLIIDGEMEEVFAWPDTEFWWNALYIEEEIVLSVDLDLDGYDDTVVLDFLFDHSWRENESIKMEFIMWNLSTVQDTDANPLDQVNHTLFIGPRTHSSSGGRDAIEFIFHTQHENEVIFELNITYPDGYEESIWYNNEGTGFALSPIDSDGDGVFDHNDMFPDNAYETEDSDGDGVGDNSDAFPNDNKESLDTDGDGIGDNSDAFPYNADEFVDSDGDGVGDNSDAFPNDNKESLDTDGDGIGDNSDAFPTDSLNGISQGSSSDSGIIGWIIAIIAIVVIIFVVIIAILVAIVLARENQFKDSDSQQIYLPSVESTAQVQNTPQGGGAQPQIPHPHLDGQFQDGHEWLEFPAQSGIWYYRNQQTRQWIKR